MRWANLFPVNKSEKDGKGLYIIFKKRLICRTPDTFAALTGTDTGKLSGELNV